MTDKSILKKLASETAIYGISTIVARFLNFLFVPLYTYTLSASDYGVVTEFMSYIAILQVLLTMGLETGCFRFANKEGYQPEKVFSSALWSVGTLSAIFLLCMVIFAKPLSISMGYPLHSLCYIYIGLILFSDSITSILFAKLRFETRAWKFATFKVVKILTETLSNLFLFLVFPKIALSHPDNFLLNFIPATPDFSYPIFSILISALVAFALFVPQMLKLGFKVEKMVLSGLMKFSLPLMVAGLPGVMNDFMDRVLFRFFNVDDSLWRSDLGIYQAAVKVAVIMSLFVQTFRFASEPFFFARAKDKDVKLTYSKIMEYFVAFCMLIFLGVVLYIDVLQFIVGRDFRSGMSIVPIMLISYILMGMLFNVSMWYKLSDKSSYAIYITLSGLVVTAVINVVFLPKYSYYAAAWGHFFSYLTMLVVSVLMGRKYYHIPYRWGKILLIVIFALIIYALSTIVPANWPMVARLSVNTVLILMYIAGYCLIEKYLTRYESKNCK